LIVYHNSYYRPGREGFDRRQKWIFNSSRTMFKYFPFWTALTMSARYFVWTTRTSILRAKFLEYFRFLWAYLRGSCVGLCHRQPMPLSTVDYYRAPDLLPECGNKPCFREGCKRWLRKRVLGR
jgi:hypothetical protein